MSQPIDLFYNSKLHRYFFTGSCRCGVCDGEIINAIVIKNTSLKIGILKEFYCLTCMEEMKEATQIKQYDNTIMATVIKKEDLPPKTIQVINERVDLVTGGRSGLAGFNPYVTTKDQEQTIDKTKLAGRVDHKGQEDFEAAKIAFKKREALLNDDNVKATDFLNELKDSKPEIEHKERRLLK